MRAVSAFGLAIVLLATSVHAQWEKHPAQSIKWKDGKPVLTGPAPKVRGGKPDLSGVWRPDPDPTGKPEGVENEINPRYFINIAADMKMEEVPFQPWARELFMERLRTEGKLDPISMCKPTGVPGIATIPLPFKVVQTPELVLILHEENTAFRQIFLDGRKPLKEPEPRWMGYSSGRWEGGTLVVESTGFRDRGWLDRMGHPHSDGLRLIERFRRVDAGHLDVDITIDDAKTYTRPLTYTVKYSLLPDEDLFEYFCAENEKDVARFK